MDDQRRAIEVYAASHGLAIERWYQDDAISGASVEARDAFKQMLADASGPRRSWSQVLVYDVSRFSRGDLDEAGYLRHQFRLLGVDVVYCNENLTGGEADELVVGVKQWMAQKFVKDLSKVTIRGQLSLSRSGAWCGGTPPFGYDLLYHDSTSKPYQRLRWLESGEKQVFDLDGKLVRTLPRGERISTSKSDFATLVPSTDERVAVIRRIFLECADLGRGFRAIASDLNRDRIPSPRDGNWTTNTKSKWSMSTIRVILKNPTYRGDSVWNRKTFAKFHRVHDGSAVSRPRVEASKARENASSDWIVVPGTQDPLVNPTLWERAQAMMASRGQNQGRRSFRCGSGGRSPYLLSGLMVCGRCGQNYQGRTVNSTKIRKDGTKIQSLYYACGGFVMKGSAACEKFLLRKDPIEELLLTTVQERLAALLQGEGEVLLRRLIDEELAAQGADPLVETVAVRARLAEIDQKAGALLDGLAPESREFVNAKLRDLAAEKDCLQTRLETLEATTYEAIDPDAVFRSGMAALANLPRLMELGTLEERKEIMQAFISGITVRPDEGRLDVLVRKIPVLGHANSSVSMVAGAGFEPATFGL